MLLSKHCSSIRGQTTVLAFTLSVTVMLLLTDVTIVHLMTKVLVSNIGKNNTRRSIADTDIDTAYEKYRRYLCQHSKSITDTIGSNTNAAILTTLCAITS